MRPIRLVIEGVNSFTDAQELDFDAVGRVNLFCICGKTGAGKTTIFDSILLALYGKSGKGNLADVVNLSRSTARVEFDFSEGGEVYRVERVIKCRGERADKSDKPDGTLIKRTAVSECTLYRAGAPIATGEAATSKIEEIVGLAAAEFKNVYLLEQGEYAEFLKLTPSKQTEAVGKIFSLTRFGEVYARANERMKEADRQAAIAKSTIENLGDASDGMLRDKKSQLSSVRAKATAAARDTERKRAELTELEKARDAFRSAQELQKAVASSAQLVQKAVEERDAALAAIGKFDAENTVDYEGELKALRERINELNVLAERDRECDGAEKAAADARKELEKKTEELERAKVGLAEMSGSAEERLNVYRAALAELEDNINSDGSEVLARAAMLARGDTVPSRSELSALYYELCGIRDRAESVSAEIKKAKDKEDGARAKGAAELEKVVKYNGELEGARADLDRAKAELEKADAELLRAQIGSHAAAVAAELHDGEACPVCGGVYHGGVCAGGDVDAKKTERDARAKDVAEREKKVAELEKFIDGAKTAYDGYDGTANTAAAERKEYELELDKFGASVEAFSAAVVILVRAGERAKAYEEAVRERDALAPAVARAEAEKEAAEKSAAEREAHASEVVERMGEYRGRAAAELEQTSERMRSVEKLCAERESMRRALNDGATAAAAALKAAEDGLAAARRACPDNVPEFDEGAYVAAKESLDRLSTLSAELGAAVAQAEAELKVAEEKVSTRIAWEGKLGVEIKTVDIYKQIADITKGKKMLDYVAAEYIEDFTATASEIIRTLSNGKYSMRYDREGGFVVSDFLNDGKERKTDTLSGGEMFLASLAVAIAIAREVSGGDNAFFFLDEGFGTLDDELIDTVYAALEGLASSCLVGVISHSSALIERMPSCVEVVEATDTMGSRIKY